MWAGPKAGTFIFYREWEPGWYSWNREWFEKPTYTTIDEGQVVFRIDEDGCEFIAVVPDGWEYDAEMIVDDAEMQGRDRYDY